MIILGKNTDDKGRQLELLTKRLLAQLGYENIITNEVGSGGDEIDVSAEFRQPGMRNAIYHEVICECKAYKNPLTLPDWLKFLGKLYSREHVRTGRAQGCFIALNGVNGNVHGHYKSLNNFGDGLQIVEGDNLLTLLCETINILPIDQVLTQVRTMTTKIAVSTDILYYQNNCYWLIEFSDETFTVFSAEGEHISGRAAQLIVDLVLQNTGLRAYVNLLAESTARTRMLVIEKYILSVLLLSPTPMSAKSILGRKAIKDVRPVTGRVNMDDLSTAIKNLIGTGLLNMEGEKYSLRTHLSGGTISHTVKFMQEFLQETVVLLALGSRQYLSLIDVKLLKQIAKHQGSLKIVKENYDDYLNLLKWSPSALTWACTPDPFLINHRKKGLQLTPQLEELGCSYFFQKLIDYFTGDYKSDGLRNYFLNKCGIVEIETIVRLKVKSNERLLGEPHYKERLALGKMDVENQNLIVPILMLHSQPEPWEIKLEKSPN